MKTQIIECIPNFSEGQNTNTIEAIANSIRQVKGVKLLHIDIGFDTNRTVMTFVGEPKAIMEAAFNAIQTATNLIDMTQHQGAHPRMGAVDVCPFVPLQNISIEETVDFVNILAKKVGDDLQIPIYLYEHSQKNTTRNNLSIIRSGQYETWRTKIKQVEWHPDYGPSTFNLKSGATVMGVRDFLVAYNINIASKDEKIADSIAKKIRTSGYIKQTKQVDGSVLKEKIKGSFLALKAIGWYMAKFEMAQVSMNITNADSTKIYEVYEAVVELAKQHHTVSKGSELIGMIPLKYLKEAGQFYYAKSNAGKNAKDIDEITLLNYGVQGLKLDALKPFVLEERVLELGMIQSGIYIEVNSE
jgi:glutamate formiminotransferase / formiminotetrahydrofolate cyclodeaminase